MIFGVGVSEFRWALIESPATRKFARAARIASLKSSRRAQRNWSPRNMNLPSSVILWRKTCGKLCPGEFRVSDLESKLSTSMAQLTTSN